MGKQGEGRRCEKKTGRKGELKARFGGKRGIGKYSCYITLILT